MSDGHFPKAPKDPTALITDEDVHVGIFLIAPDVAANWLRDFNVHNRPLQERHSEHLQRDIEAGRWRLTHQGVAIDAELRLLDGQHRLRAIAASGRAVPIQVTWNLDPEVFPVIDTGKRRTAADALSLAGVKVKNRALSASTAKFLLGRRTLSMSQFSNGLTMTNEDVLSAIRDLGEERVARAVTVGQRLGSLNGTVVAAFVYTMERLDVPLDVVTDDFLVPIWKGLGLTSEADPRYAARAYFERHSKTSLTNRRRAEMYTVLCQAWNAWAKGGERRLFRTPTEFVDITVFPEAQSFRAARGLPVVA